MEHKRKKKGSSKLLIIMVIVLALLAIAAIFALKFYTDINNPENLFESTLPEGTPAPVETAPAPAAGGVSVVSPMPGTVLDVKAPVGTQVAAGQCVIML